MSGSGGAGGGVRAAGGGGGGGGGSGGGFPELLPDVHTSLMAKHLTVEMYEALRETRTALAAFTLDQAIAPGLRAPAAHIGLQAADLDTFDRFATLFDKVIDEWHSWAAVAGATRSGKPEPHKSDLDAGKLDALPTLGGAAGAASAASAASAAATKPSPSPAAAVVRISVSRNLAEHHPADGADDFADVERAVLLACARCNTRGRRPVRLPREPRRRAARAAACGRPLLRPLDAAPDAAAASGRRRRRAARRAPPATPTTPPYAPVGVFRAAGHLRCGSAADHIPIVGGARRRRRRRARVLRGGARRSPSSNASSLSRASRSRSTASGTSTPARRSSAPHSSSASACGCRRSARSAPRRSRRSQQVRPALRPCRLASSSARWRWRRRRRRRRASRGN